MKKISDKIIKEIDIFLKNEINNNNIINLYLKVGEILSTLSNITYTNWFEIENDIRKQFGLMICFSRKNLNYMLKFYQYSLNTKENLYNIDWNTYLFILKHKDYKDLMMITLKENLNKRELEYYIKNNNIKRIPKQYIDPSFDELTKLQDYLNKNA